MDEDRWGGSRTLTRLTGPDPPQTNETNLRYKPSSASRWTLARIGDSVRWMILGAVSHLSTVRTMTTRMVFRTSPIFPAE